MKGECGDQPVSRVVHPTMSRVSKEYLILTDRRAEVLMNEAQFYRVKAQHCERLAAGTFDGEVKKKLIALSLWWRERADEEESTPRANFLI
jgi:hypothetical protein